MTGHLSLRACVVVLVLLAIGTGPILAQGNSPQLVIINAVPNVSEGSLTITGVNFGDSAPWVTFDGVPLPIVSSSDTQILVLLPRWVATGQGTYLLTVYRQQGAGQTAATAGPGDKRFAASYVTIGAVGPQGEAGAKGDKGDKGDAGETGPDGPQGLAGERGTDGAPGADGASGANGDKGDKGDKGDAGDKGDTGAQGDKGETGATGATGDKGAPGGKGDIGATGVTGDKGDKGDKGDEGDQGPIGPQGPEGSSGTTSWVDGTGQVNTADKVGIGNTTFTPDAPLHVRRDVPGPGNDCPDLPGGAFLVTCYARAYEPKHHAVIVENNRKADNANETEMLKFNTGGLAVVLHSYDQPNDEGAKGNLGFLNAINSSDKFISFFRKDQSTDAAKMVGRIQGVSPAETIDTFRWNAQMVAIVGQAFEDNFKFNFVLHPFEDWFKYDFKLPTFDRGELPRADWHNADECEGDFQGDWELEICTKFVFDLDFDFGKLPNITDWGHLNFDGSTGPIKEITFGIKDGDLLGQMAAKLGQGLGNRLLLVNEVYNDPLGFAVRKMLVAAAGAGVTYESGSGDYAEWLERATPDEPMMAGDIVGVVGGRITRNTRGADHVMSISVKPIVLGNMPTEGREHLYEKVAFMGQTPVKVRGRVRVGDFIVPSGLNDGIGKAVRPDNITADQLGSVVGIAWEESNLPYRVVSAVNVAVGLKSADIGRVVARQEATLTTVVNENAAIRQQLTALTEENAAIRQQLAAIAEQLDALTRNVRR